MHRDDTQALLAELVQINAAIRKQIPHAINRSDFINTNNDEKWKEMHAYYLNRFTSTFYFEICEYINKEYAEHTPNRNNLENFKHKLLVNIKTFLQKYDIHTNKESFLELIGMQAKQTVCDYVTDNIDKILQLKMAGIQLSLSDKKAEDDIKKANQLAHYRDLLAKQHEANQVYLKDNECDEPTKILIHKRNVLLVGTYFSRIECDVAYCEEFACLAVKKIYAAQVFCRHYQLVVEKFHFMHANGDGHTFLILNRDPTKPIRGLKDLNDDAIILDAWENFVGHKQNLAANKDRYELYPQDDGLVLDVTFTSDDAYLVNQLTVLDDYYYIAENEDIRVRLPILLREYEMVTLELPHLAKLKEFLYRLLTECQPNHFPHPVTLYLTTCGNDAIAVVEGCDAAVVAIHSDFLTSILDNEQAISMLQFGLSYALLQIKHTGIGLFEHVSPEEAHQWDKQILEKTHEGEAAIAYLRHAAAFKESHKSRIFLPHIDPFTHYYKATPEQRIKNLMTAFAVNPQLCKTVCKHVKLNGAITEEIRALKKPPAFFTACNQYITNVAKLKYLQNVLPDLYIELIPYELEFEAVSSRVKDFCAALGTFMPNINWQDKNEVAAVDELIDTAFKLRIPAFDRIYFAVAQTPHDLEAKTPLPAFGIFKKYQLGVQKFLKASNLYQAQASAKDLCVHLALLSKHFNSMRPVFRARLYVSDFKTKHAGHSPRGTDRYFGTTIGTRITHKLKHLAVDHQLPWHHLLDFIPLDESKIIATTLIELGINLDQRIWQAFTPEQLYQLAEKSKMTISECMDIPQQYTTASKTKLNKKIAQYLSNNHHPKVRELSTSLDFEAAFCKFYDANWPALIAPGLTKGHNVNNSCVHLLLTKFVDIALHGSEQDKAVVKSFFGKRADSRNMENLCLAFDGQYRDAFPPEVNYVRFVVLQEYNNQSFNLFTTQEICQILDNYYFKISKIPIDYYLRLFKIPLDLGILEQLEKLIPLMLINKIHGIEDVLVPMVKQISCTSLSSEAFRLINLIDATPKMGRKSYFSKSILRILTWVSPDEVNTQHLNLNQLILLYLYYDANLHFPSPEEEEKLAALISKRIRAITDRDERIQLYEKFLMPSTRVIRHGIYHIKFRDKLIQLWVEDNKLKYGLDDNSVDYFKRVNVLVEHAHKNAPTRDLKIMLDKFSQAIESQLTVSEAIGRLVEPDKYKFTHTEMVRTQALNFLATVTQFFSNCQEDQIRFVDFISSPLTDASRAEFVMYLLMHKHSGKFRELLKHVEWTPKTPLEEAHMLSESVTTIFHMFWDCTLEIRAVLIDYLMIPAAHVVTASRTQQAYEDAYQFIGKRLFPDADKVETDDHFALAFLQAYLFTAEPYQRSYLLSGLLVAANLTANSQQKISTGKKLSVLCEHLGPAYIKLAQAIHSHPRTPKAIRDDLAHIKGNADPITRWDLWRRILLIVPASVQEKIALVGPPLGSASYNAATRVKMVDGQHRVLTIQRENAAENAEKGYLHLERAVLKCDHERIAPVRSTFVSMIKEAHRLSKTEMSCELSQKQFASAAKIYDLTLFEDAGYAGIISPTKLYQSGHEYRLIQEMPGVEFNDLPSNTPEEKQVKLACAKIILILEFIIILRGGLFDSDRHGNQLRIQIDKPNKVLRLGLYDFGEMALAPPSAAELAQLAAVFADLPLRVLRDTDLQNMFDNLLSEHIERLMHDENSVQYLIRVRKAILAMHDFMVHLDTKDFLTVLKQVSESGQIHPLIQPALKRSVQIMGLASTVYQSKERLLSSFNFLNHEKTAPLQDRMKKNIP